jgi:hypothetical protein
MQDHCITDHGQVSGGALVTVPASVVDWVRRAAYAEIGSAAERLDTAAFSTDREAHPEWFCGPVESLREVYALLEAIGWAKTDPPLGVQIDLSEDGWALMRVLASALEFADEDIDRTPCSRVEHAERQDLPCESDTEIERVAALWSFTATTQARIDALAVREEEGTVLDIAA